MQHLAVKVGNIDLVGIDQAETADTGSSKVKRRGRAQGTGADQKHGGIF